jgi:hypothetical protein
VLPFEEGLDINKAHRRLGDRPNMGSRHDGVAANSQSVVTAAMTGLIEVTPVTVLADAPPLLVRRVTSRQRSGRYGLQIRNRGLS